MSGEQVDGKLMVELLSHSACKGLI